MSQALKARDVTRQDAHADQRPALAVEAQVRPCDRQSARSARRCHVLERGFNPGAPDQAWVCDITYIRTRNGWLYLAAVLDLYSRRMSRIHDGRLIAQYDYPHDDRKNVAARRRAPGWVRCVPE